MSVEAVRAALAIRAQHLTTGERFVLVSLAEHASMDPDGDLVAYPSGTLMALETGLTREYVQACLKRLRDLRVVAVKGKRRRVNVYALNMPTIYGWGRVLSDGLTQSCGLTSQVTVNSPDTEPSKEPQVEPEASIDGHGFDEFWDAYPRKVSKVAARREWPRALKLATADEIIAGARSYAADPNRSPEFTKHPSTWLHKGCWDDEPLPQRSQQGGKVSPRDTNQQHWDQGGGFVTANDQKGATP